MWGKHFESMYEGSMYGAGVAVFAVWGYVISHVRNGVVELNPRKLADTLGGDFAEIESAIQFLGQPDPKSRHKEESGRRLVQEGEFQYRVPSWQHYQKIMNEADRREYNRLAQQRHREKKRPKKQVAADYMARERRFDKAVVRGDEQQADQIAAEGL